MNRSRICFMLMVSLASAGVAVAQENRAAADTNLILNRPYTYFPMPDYSYCTDRGDSEQLTDGKAAGSIKSIWRLRSTVGWIAGVDVPVVIHFELKEETTLSELKFNTVGGGGSGIMDVGIRVFGSLDNKTYVLIGDLPAPRLPREDQKKTYLVQKRVPLNQARAKYVAVVAMAPAPYYFVFADEIALIGKSPATPASTLPVIPGVQGSSAKELQELLRGGRRAFSLAQNLTDPIERQTARWPKPLASQAHSDKKIFLSQSLKVKDHEEFEKLRLAYTAKHHKLAQQVYSAGTLLWPTVPDEQFVMLSLPDALKPTRKVTAHTVINALEATAFGATNLTEEAQSLTVSVSGGGPGSPKLLPRVARFSRTKGSRYVADALVAADCPQNIPAGESKLIWVGIESTGAMPGTYHYHLEVRIGEQRHNIPIDVVVHNVTLSKTTPLKTFNWAYLDGGNNGSPLFRKVRTSMLEHRITTGACTAIGNPSKDAQGNIVRPVEIDLTMLDKYLDFHKDFQEISFFWSFHPRFNPPSRDMFGSTEWMSDEYKAVFKEWLVKFVDHLKSRGRGYDSFYLQMFDETRDDKVAQICRLVHEADSKVRMMITGNGSALPQGLIDGGMNIFVHHAPRLGYDTLESFSVLRSGGRELWFYHAADSEAGYGVERDPLDAYRLLHWLAFRHGATGVGFWNMLNERTSCWASDQVFHPMVYTNPDLRGNPAPQDVKTAETVIPSRRWEYRRMGIEDYMLLQLAQQGISRLVSTEQSKQQQKLDDIVKAATRTLPIRTSYERRLKFRKTRQALITLVENVTDDQAE